MIPFVPRSDFVAPSNTRTPTVLGQGAAAYPRYREMAALVLWTIALFLALAFASYAGDPMPVQPPLEEIHGADWVGPVGEYFARSLVTLLGYIAWVFPLEALLLGIPFVRGKKSLATPARLAGDLLIAILAAAMIQVAAPGKMAFGHHVAGGAVGELFGELSRSLFSTAGSFLLGFSALGMILIGRASFSFIALMHGLAKVGQKGAAGTAYGWAQVKEAWATARALEKQKTELERARRMPAIDTSEHDDALAFADQEPESDEAFAEAADAQMDESPAPISARVVKTDRAEKAEKLEKAPAARGGRAAKADKLEKAEKGALVVLGKPEEPEAPKPKRERKPRKAKAVVEPEPELEEEDAEEETTDEDEAEEGESEEEEESDEIVDEDEEASEEDGEEEEEEETEEAEEEPEPVPAPKPRASRAKANDERPAPQIVDTSAALMKEAPVQPSAPAVVEEKQALAAPPAKSKDRMVPAHGEFRLPLIDFLVPATIDPTLIIDKEVLFKNAELLVKTLGDYGVTGKVEDILPGPTVTTFEVSAAAGTKVAKVAGLADDLALALAKKVRIVAPIPGKNRIGFELPNDRRVPVNLRDLVDDRRFQELDVPLPMVLGRDILGNPVYADLASMPHVIVAGATGAGKSVGLNVMLTSLLYRRTPEELRLLMIDPKVVELAPFDRIPHMLLPVVTDMKQAALALKWAVDEMERRYQLFADAGTKNLGTYNGWVDRVIRGDIRNPLKKKVMGKDHNGLPDMVDPELGSNEGEAPLPERLPSIVLVVDEFADLMMQQGKDVEAAVARLAQKARAAGMHVILATQRPSVDVITGMIKANFPTRIAYRVAQKVDSRTILDEQGAEHLLGRGDMLIKLNGTNETKRVQCPWVSEEEVQTVTDFLRLQGEPVYDENILKPRDDDDGGAAEEEAEQDSMYDDAIRVVADTRRCSTSWLQRKLGLGYNRAARIVEMMERRGIVGPANGSKDREVLISSL